MNQRLESPSQRNVKGYLIEPKSQLKYALIAAFVFLCGLASMVWLSLSAHNKVLERLSYANAGADAFETIKVIQDLSLRLQITVGVLSVVVMFTLMIFITHRFVGPTIAIMRYLENLRKSPEKAKLSRREYDSLDMLFDYLNSVEIQVKKKEGAVLEDEASKRNPFNNESGMTLVEVLMSVFIMSIVMTSFMGNMDFFNKEMRNLQSKGTNSQVSSVVRLNVKDYSSLTNSAMDAANSRLSTCLNGLSATGCVHNQDYEFNYLSSQRTQATVGPNNTTVYSPEPIGGVSSISCRRQPTDAYAVFYTTNGKRCNCTDDAKLCPLQVVTKFAALCESGSTCRTPQAIRVSYEVVKRSDLPASADLRVGNEKGQFIVSRTDEEFFTKFNFAGAYNIELATGNEYVTNSLTENDIRLGKTLRYTKPAKLKFEASYATSSDVVKMEMKRFVYPDGCDMMNLGTVDSSGADCRPPSSLSSYATVQTITFAGSKLGTLDLQDSVLVDRVVEYKLDVYDSSGVLVDSSAYLLRAVFKDVGYLSVTPPARFIFACNDDSTNNTFIMQAKPPKAGWKLLTATLNPPAQYQGQQFSILPGFDKFDQSKTTAQNIVVDSKYFSPGTTYQLTFSGQSNDGQLSKAQVSFTTQPKPTVFVSVTNPYEAASVRSVSDLVATVDMNLPCKQNPKDVTFKIDRATGINLMPDRTMTGDCVAVAGSEDENKFKCTKTLTCPEWLNVSDTSFCQTKLPADTALVAKAQMKDEDGNAYADSNNFTAGAKISLRLTKNSVQFINFRISTGGLNVSPPSRLPVVVQFASPLMSGESVVLKLEGAGTSKSFTCKYGVTSGTAAYNTSTSQCTLQLDSPSSSQSFTLVAGDTSTTEVLNPSTVNVRQYGNAEMACSTMVGAPVCSAGKTLKLKLVGLGIHDSTWENTNSSNYFYRTYTPVNSTSALDFFMSYLPLSASVDPIIRVTMTFGAGSNGYQGGIADDSMISRTTMSNLARCSSTMSCAADVGYVPPAFYDSKRSLGSSFWLDIQNSDTSRGSRDYGVVRECYCE